MGSIEIVCILLFVALIVFGFVVVRRACRRALNRASELLLSGRHEEATQGLNEDIHWLTQVAPFFASDLWHEMHLTLDDIQKHKEYGEALERGEAFMLRDMIIKGGNPFLTFYGRRKELEEKYPELLKMAQEKYGKF